MNKIFLIIILITSFAAQASTCEISKLFVGGFGTDASEAVIEEYLELARSGLISKGYLFQDDLKNNFKSFKGGVIHSKGYWSDKESNSLEVGIFVSNYKGTTITKDFSYSSIKVIDSFSYEDDLFHIGNLAGNMDGEKFNFGLNSLPDCQQILSKQNSIDEQRWSSLKGLSHYKEFVIKNKKVSLIFDRDSDSEKGRNRIKGLAQAAVKNLNLSRIGLLTVGRDNQLRDGMAFLNPVMWISLRIQAAANAKYLLKETTEICKDLNGKIKHHLINNASCAVTGVFYTCSETIRSTCYIN